MYDPWLNTTAYKYKRKKAHWITPKAYLQAWQKETIQFRITLTTSLKIYLQWHYLNTEQIHVTHSQTNRLLVTKKFHFLADYHPCNSVTCPYYGVCQAAGPTTHSCICIPCSTNESEPLCDNKGITHQSICQYKFKVCEDKEEPGIEHYGSCKRECWPSNKTGYHPTLNT